ncbi:MAG: alpha/beta hydrolase, partial [Actinobacteria bacterium]|nr:alpha/beta hydrolase [Actinomycetota bacterium]
MPDALETRFARLGDARIAYQVWGTGPPDLVAARPLWAPVDLLWDEPRVAHTLERLGGFARNIWFDARGMGSSSRETFTGPEIWLDDLDAVMAGAGSERAVLLGIEDGGPGALLYAATFPMRISALVLVNTHARFVRAADYPLGMPPEVVDRYVETVHSTWATMEMVEFLAPSMVDDELWARWWLRSQRLAGTADAVARGWRTLTETNVHHVLSSIQVPTLVLHRRGDRHVRVEHGRYLADHIPGATYRELDGDDHVFLAGDTDAMVDEIEEFLTGVRP